MVTYKPGERGKLDAQGAARGPRGGEEVRVASSEFGGENLRTLSRGPRSLQFLQSGKMMKSEATDTTTNILIHSSRSAPYSPGASGVQTPRATAPPTGNFAQRKRLSSLLSRAAPFCPGGALDSLRFSFQILKKNKLPGREEI
ncbi:hypothetical protein H1C71_009132 [Ictidomys tridecemlineatus]|nr:hypothetical protein H1C71_009132 [Ictidomys tridecemlineatus]KAG3285521.1 hypothetical protein H1C71_009132 [Ictidomys tridecemlineatus]